MLGLLGLDNFFFSWDWSLLCHSLLFPPSSVYLSWSLSLCMPLLATHIWERKIGANGPPNDGLKHSLESFELKLPMVTILIFRASFGAIAIQQSVRQTDTSFDQGCREVSLGALSSWKTISVACLLLVWMLTILPWWQADVEDVQDCFHGKVYWNDMHVLSLVLSICIARDLRGADAQFIFLALFSLSWGAHFSGF